MFWRRWLPRSEAVEPSSPPTRCAAGVFGCLSDGLPPEAVAGAGFWPGFALDLTCWRVLVTATGRVRADVHDHAAGGPDVFRTVEADRDPARVAELLRDAERLDFAGLPGWVRAGVDDCRLISVAVRSSRGVKVVCAERYPLDGEVSADLARLLALWHGVVRLAPQVRKHAEPTAAPAPAGTSASPGS